MFETILAITMIFISATVMLAITAKAGQPTIAGYIIAGFLIGPFIDGSLLLDLVQMGVLFLTFIIGVRSGSENVVNVVKYGFKITVIQLPLIFAISFGVAWLLGLNYLNATYFSIAAAFSSTLVGTDLGPDFKELNLVFKRIAESINIIEDFIAIVIILVISIVPLTGLSVSTGITYGIALLLISVLVREVIFPWLARLVDFSSEFMMLLGLSFLSAFIGLCVYFEISIIYGAFLSGIALSKHPYEIKLLDTMGSLMEFFSAIFFVTLGALLVIPDYEMIIYALSIIVITLVLKPLLMAQIIIWKGYNKRTAVNASLQLDHVSEFALIISIQAAVMGYIDISLFNAIIVASVITMIASSYTSVYADYIFSFIHRFLHQSKGIKDAIKEMDINKLEGHIIVVGYGIKARKIVSALKQHGYSIIVIENDPLHLQKLKEIKVNYLFMDALDWISWKTARVDKARLIIVTPPKYPINELALKLASSADVIVSSYDVTEAKRLLGLGAVYVNIPLYLGREKVREVILDILKGTPDKVREENKLMLDEYDVDDQG